jgi:hypothetical protein
MHLVPSGERRKCMHGDVWDNAKKWIEHTGLLGPNKGELNLTF